MWYWITISILLFILLLAVEEFFYYSWNRYVYGPNIKRRKRWLSRVISVGVVLFKKLFHKKELSKTNSDKSLPL